jgi:hypothetical protein
MTANPQPGPGESGDAPGGSGGEPAVTAGEGAVTISAGLRLRVAFLLAIVADALQLAVIPLFVEGAESPAADIVDVAMTAAMFFLLGWHWEFLPSFAAKLIPGVDLVPLWTLAVANVYRKAKRSVVVAGPGDPAP